MESGADFSPSRGDQDFMVRVRHESCSESRGQGELLEKAAKPLYIHQISDGVFAEDQIGIA